MRESRLLAHIYGRSEGMGRGRPDIEAGPGDDCAVVIAGGERLLLTTDQLVEGRHFDPATPIDLIARKAVARSVSDIAAMAGTPRWGLAAATLRRGWEHGDELFDAMARWAQHWGCPLVGGDIAIHDGPIVLTTTVVGTPHRDRGPVLRSGARPGDVVFVTGALGGSLGSDRMGRHLTFEPRLEEARVLADVLGRDLHAMMDLSDGLGIDADRLARASGIMMDVDASAVPAAPGCGVESALADGEDYELLFVVDGKAADRVPSELETPRGVTPVTRIGRALDGDGCIVVMPDGSRRRGDSLGYEHR